jgi:hypothetical protein
VCSTGSWNIAQRSPHFTSALENSDPVDLMKALRDTHIAGAFTGSTSEMSMELNRQLANMRQLDREDVYSYHVRVKELVATCEAREIHTQGESELALGFLQRLLPVYRDLYRSLRQSVLVGAAMYPDTIESAATLAVGFACDSSDHQISECPIFADFKGWKDAERYEIRALKEAAQRNGPTPSRTTDGQGQNPGRGNGRAPPGGQGRVGRPKKPA